MSEHQLRWTSYQQALASGLAMMSVFKAKYFVFRDEDGKWTITTCELRDIMRTYERPEWPR